LVAEQLLKQYPPVAHWPLEHWPLPLQRSPSPALALLQADAGPQTFPTVPAAQQPLAHWEFVEQLCAHTPPVPKSVQYPSFDMKLQHWPFVEQLWPSL
jgi:hypothetical protein